MRAAARRRALTKSGRAKQRATKQSKAAKAVHTAVRHAAVSAPVGRDHSREVALAKNAREASSAAPNSANENSRVPNSPTKRTSQAASRLPVVSGTAGDHLAVHELLTVVFQRPSRDAFVASLDDPFYEPHDRLLVKSGQRLVSHVHTTKRVMHFGPLRVPVAGVDWLATLPEHRGQGHATRVMAAAEQAVVAEGAELGLLRTRIPYFFRAAGWAVCGRHSLAQAGARELLAQIIPQAGTRGFQRFNVRPCRQVELPALMRVYLEGMRPAVGPLERSEAYWRWLISSRGYDQIFVAVDGPDRANLTEEPARLAGYAVLRDAEILELGYLPDQPAAGARLLARACGEAIERDQHGVTLHAPEDEPLFSLFAAAGGTRLHHESDQGEVLMVKVFDPPAFLKRLCPILHARADAARLTRPCELGLLVEGQKYRLTLTRRSVKLSRHKIGRSYLSCNLAEFTRLLLGHLDLTEAMTRGRIECSTRLALETAQELFPRQPFWHSPWDDTQT